MPNALAQESSPYLRQHAHNPVEWVPWGPQAFARAHERCVPLLVSIGYSSCHWCHVMERESFEDERTARVMNESFVCVKVDREERPDVDALYMEAVQGMTGSGGWPLNVFLTPDGLPFYGGTYFPPDQRAGMPAFTQVLQAISEAWEQRGAEISATGEQLRAQLAGAARLEPSDRPIDPDSLDRAVERIAGSFDAIHGGFGTAPKFPQASAIEFLLCRARNPPAGPSAPDSASAPADRPSVRAEHGAKSPDAARMALYTLRSMASGGIHDQVGGGFHRYSVDANWTVPHFEKMLYDNALLARAYLHGYALCGDERLRDVCRDTLDWALREMRGPEGGFYSALDADSEGVEGRFYVWTVAELRAALTEAEPVKTALTEAEPVKTALTEAEPAEAALTNPEPAEARSRRADSNESLADAAIAWLGASEQGNFDDPHHPAPGRNVLEDRGPRPPEPVCARIRARLLAARGRRARPGLDDKRLTSWNALMICALADAGAALAEPRYLDAATRCAEFLLADLRDERGRLLRTYTDGQAKIGAYLEDHAFLLEALIALFEATCEERWLAAARALAQETIERFVDSERGGFYSTAADGEALIVRRKEIEDSPMPSGSSSAALGLLRLAELTGEQRYEREAVRALALVHELAPRHPLAFGHLLQAIHWHTSLPRPLACELPAR